MSRRLSLGISEDREFEYTRIPAEAFSRSGRYRAALAQLQKLTSSPSFEARARKYWDRCLASGSTLPAADYEGARARYKADIEWILVYEAEHARIWNDGPVDYHEALRKYQRQAKADSARISGALAELRRFDRKHAYLLRHSVQRAMQNFLSDNEAKKVRRPNANAKNGFDTVTVSGPQVRHSEFQYLSKLAFFSFSEFLDSWDREIAAMFSEWPAHWKEFGALRFERAISPIAAAKLDVVQLGLIARLTSRLRDFTAGYGVWTYSTGQPVPTHGKPCWEIVAEFVNCSLGPNRELSGETARRIWQSIAAKHVVTMQSWPGPSKSESQVQEILDQGSATPKE